MAIIYQELYNKGVRNFVVDESFEADAIDSLSRIKFFTGKRCTACAPFIGGLPPAQFNIPVIGITGSNGKTIVKEWLYQLLQDDYNIVRSPKSYNSQIGVPLSVWQMNENTYTGIFEAGISQPGEMQKLEKIIQPDYRCVYQYRGCPQRRVFKYPPKNK